MAGIIDSRYYDLSYETLDVIAFAEHPKCIKSFFDVSTGAGCLMTAFGVALGFKAYSPSGEKGDVVFQKGGIKLDITKFCNSIDMLANKLGIVVYFDNPVLTALGYLPTRKQFSLEIIDLYDYGKEPEALNLMWELIDKFPNKKGNVTKEQVVMPVCATV